MNKQQIIKYIEQPEILGENDCSTLKTLSENYPYSGILQTLYAKALHNCDSIFFEKQLKKTAIVNANRKKLYQIIHQPKLQKTIDKIEIDTQLEAKETQRESAEQLPDVDTTRIEEEENLEKSFDEVEKNILIEAINKTLAGGPSCAEDGWRFLFNFAEWGFIFFLIYLVSTILKLRKS